MESLDLALVDWADGRPRLLGRLADPDLVEQVRQRLAAGCRRELAALDPRPLRLVPDQDGGERQS